MDDNKNQYENDSFEDFESIINLPHPTSKKHPRMPLINRAAQFAPFSALSGHGDAVKRTASQFESE